jgi:DNA replication initiation complex subunit (GINS family)
MVLYKEVNMITAELTRKINMLSEDSYNKVEDYVENLLESKVQANKARAFEIFMSKMNEAEKSLKENGYYTEEEVEEELAKV